MPTDLTVTLENRPGTLAELGEALGNAGVNIRAIAGFSTGSSGVAHLVVDDSEKAMSALASAVIAVDKSTEALSVELEDRPGSLGEYARKLANAGVNIEAAYIGGSSGGKVELIFAVDDAEKARNAG